MSHRAGSGDTARKEIEKEGPVEWAENRENSALEAKLFKNYFKKQKRVKSIICSQKVVKDDFGDKRWSR